MGVINKVISVYITGTYTDPGILLGLALDWWGYIYICT